MMSFAFHWIVNWILSWGGISLLVAAAAGTVWWFVPVPSIRSLALHVAVGALAFATAYTMGYQNGASTVRAEWQSAVQAEAVRSVDARSEAEQTVSPVEPAPPAEQSAPAPNCPAVPSAPRARNDGVLRGDPLNRNRERR